MTTGFDVDATRIEEAGLNALQTQRQLFFDGWLLRLSPGKAKRARSVNPCFGSSRPLDAKIDHCEALYASHGLPLLFRMTPFVRPPDLAPALAAREYVEFDPTLVQAARIDGARAAQCPKGIDLAAASAPEFVEAAGDLRGSSPLQRAAHLERLTCSPLALHAIVARSGGNVVACGLVIRDDTLAGIYDMMTADAQRGRGLATTLVASLLQWAARQGGTHAYLQVNADNAAALAVYRRFGFATMYTYHYCARPGQCR